MNAEKAIAKIVEKCYAGKAKDKNLEVLLSYLLAHSTLGESLQKNIPDLNLKMEDKRDGTLVTLGEYSLDDHNVYLNGRLVKEAKNGVERALFQLLETYGHEMTHHDQYLKGTLDNHSNDNKLSKSTVAGMCQAAGKNFSEQDYHDASHGSYLKLPHEEGAREGGSAFVIEALEHLVKNPYLKDSVREKLQADLEYAIQNSVDYKKRDEEYYLVYDNFKLFLKTRRIEDFMNDIGRTERYPGLEYENAVRIWLDANEPDKIIQSYVSFIGTGNEYSTLRDLVTKHIKDESFPKESRDKLVGIIFNGLKNKDMGPENYEERINDFLDETQVLEIYESLLKRDISKIDCPMFKKYKNRSDEFAKLGEILANNLEHIKINAPEEAELLKEELCNIIFVAKNKLKPESLEKLQEARKKLVQKLQVEEEGKEVKKNK